MTRFIQIDPLTEKCGVCERRITVVAPWVPFGGRIRHTYCEPACRACGGELDDDFYTDDNGFAYCDPCWESLDEDAR